ncbi:serpin family protein [Endozoicomonas sp. YOMI1]|uniref:serpin family protein n=1 Tax=Endozoicomonas sp. YOMI1 TaxID=2828739 RepID=UPI002148F91E|nr:serpin family protein [Endozoicomonas sp. YOMI1]
MIDSCNVFNPTPQHLFSGVDIIATEYHPGDYAKTIVQECIRKLSFALIDPAGTRSTALSTASLASALGMLLAAIDDVNVKEKILGMTNQRFQLTPALEKEIHSQLGRFSQEYACENNSKIFTVNFIASQYHCRDSELAGILSKCYETKQLETIEHKNVADVTEEFVKSKTKGHISSLFTSEERDYINLSMGNVSCFNGIWTHAFNSKESSDFLCADGSKTAVEMMISEPRDFKCALVKGFAAITIPFFQHGTEKLHFVAITPIKSSPNGIDHLDTETLHQLIDQSLEAKEQKITLKLPKIKIESTDTSLLNKIGKFSGVEITADMLTKLGGTKHDDLDMRQKIHATIDKEGAQVVSTTVVNRITRGFTVESPEPEKSEPFTFDCPGYIAIVIEDDNGKHLFLESIIKDTSYFVPAESTKVQPHPLSNRSVQKLEGNTAGTDSIFRPAEEGNGAKSLKNSVTLFQGIAGPLGQNEILASIQMILNKDNKLNILGILYNHENQTLHIKIKDFNQAQELNKKIIEFTGARDSGSYVSAVDFDPTGKNNSEIFSVVRAPLTFTLLNKLFLTRIYSGLAALGVSK